MKRVLRAIALACAFSGTASAATEMAVTIDDLPTHGALPPGMQRVTIAEQIISVLKRHAVPEVYGFVNGAQIRDDPQHTDILRIWRQAGLRVGNHTFSHPNLNRVSAADYIADIHPAPEAQRPVPMREPAEAVGHPSNSGAQDFMLRRQSSRRWAILWRMILRSTGRRPRRRFP
jgi:hypothetical protein